MLISTRLLGLPESVKSLRAHLAAADALFFGVEEFNGSVSGNFSAPSLSASKAYCTTLLQRCQPPLWSLLFAGVLKNAIDWASRSYEGAESPLKGKFSAAVGAGGRLGAARAHASLRPILKELGCVHMPAPELQIQRWGPGPATFDANGSLCPVFSPAMHA
jgi:NAD(P)H-dependent FMN reductase